MSLSPSLISSTLLTACFTLCVCTAEPVYAQTDAWVTHTSLRQIVDITSSPEAIWAATEGGVFRYEVASGSISRFTTTEGLSGLNITALTYEEATQSIWIGYGDGVLDRLDIESQAVRTFLDIPRSQFGEKDIRKLAITGDSLIVATGFGIVLFNTERGEVIETFSRFGDDISLGPASDMTITTIPDGLRRLWVTISSETVNAVVSAPLDSPNLQDPSTWRTEMVGNGTFAVRSIGGFGDRIYVGTERGLFARDFTSGYRQLNVTNGDVTTLIPLEDRLIGLEDSRIIALEPGESTRTLGSGGLLRLANLLEGPDGNLWVGDNIEGLTVFEPFTASTTSPTIVRESFFPSGPFDGQFTEITFDNDGNLWLGGIPGADKGFYKFSADGEWTSYIKRFFFELVGKQTRFNTIHTDSQSNAWAGSSGGGLVQVDRNGELAFYDHTNSTLLEIDDNFVLVRGISSEADGTLWVSNTGGSRPLHVRLLDGSWTSFPSVIGSSRTYQRIFVDNFRQKWIVPVATNNLESEEGLLVLDTGDNVTDPSDDSFRYFSERGSNGQGLPSTTVNSIAEDKSGRLWVGTDEGLAYFQNTGIVAQDPNSVPLWPLLASRQPGESQFLLFGLKINAVTVDPADNLWVGTDIGAFYIEEREAGFDIIQQYTQQNSPILSDVILSIAVDERTGEVYFSTDLGLISFQGDATAPAEEKQDLFVYPNPVRIENDVDPDIIIEGLVDETTVRILTASGSLVQSIEARGGRIRWNARDADNRLVPSGMYIVVALDRNGSGSAYGKVAVIR